MTDLLDLGFPAAAAVVAALAFVVTLALTPPVAVLARRIGAVAPPKPDRWHQKPTAMLGGIAIFLPVMATTMLLARGRHEIWYLAGASTVLFAVGLIDDFHNIRPYQKLTGQIIGSALLIHSGLVLPWTHSMILNMSVTLVWLIGITNSVNMLDNMDGLSVGVAAIAAFFLAVTFYGNRQWSEAVMLAGFAASLAGFLVYNRHPASIFMGDCGSLFVGFFLAAGALLSGTGGGRSRSIVAVLAVPVLVLLVPIFDTTFVTVMRKLAGRAASQGGRDHTSHRLVALGLSEKHAVWMLYALAFCAGTLALLVRRVSLDFSVVSIAFFTVALTFLGIHLAQVHVYEDSELAAAREKPLVSFLLDLSSKRRIFEVLFDVGLISVSYYLAYALKFGPFRVSSGDWRLFFSTLPIIVCAKAAAFLAAGVYRSFWRYTSLPDVIALVRASVIGSVAGLVAVVFVFRFEGFSRTVFALDGLILLLLAVSSRFAFRIIQRLFPSPNAHDAKRVLVYGAGDGGELLLREIENNADLHYVAVGFVDDDASKRGRFIHGLRVYSRATPLPELCRRLRVAELLVSTSKLEGERLAQVIAECTTAGIAVTRAFVTFQPLTPPDSGWVIPAAAIAAGIPLVRQRGSADVIEPHTRTDH